MNKYSNFTDYFSIQISLEVLKCQSCGCKGWALIITMINASYWPLITFLLGIRYLVGYPKRGGSLGCVYQQNISGFRKEVKGNPGPDIKFIVRGYPQVAVCGFLRTRRRPHVDNPRECKMYRQSGKTDSLKFIFVDLKVPLCL